MALVAGIGAGIFILAFIWVVSLFLYFVLSRASGSLSYGGIGAILLAILVTIILWFFPRGTDPSEDYTIYDDIAIGRTILIVISGLMLCVGSSALGALYIFDPLQAEVLRE